MDKKPYEKIYLIGWYPDYPRPDDFGDEVTWCQDPIGEDDECPNYEYIRGDIVTAKDEQLTKANERVAELEDTMKNTITHIREFGNGKNTQLDNRIIFELTKALQKG